VAAVNIDKNLKAIEVLTSSKFRKAVAPLIEERKQQHIKALCRTDKDSERERGRIDSLDWLIRLHKTLTKEVQDSGGEV